MKLGGKFAIEVSLELVIIVAYRKEQLLLVATHIPSALMYVCDSLTLNYQHLIFQGSLWPPNPFWLPTYSSPYMPEHEHPLGTALNQYLMGIGVL